MRNPELSYIYLLTSLQSLLLISHSLNRCIIDSGVLWQNEQLSSVMMPHLDSLSFVTNIEFKIRYWKSLSLADFVQEYIAL